VQLAQIVTKPGFRNRWDLSKFVIKTSRSQNIEDVTSVDIPLLGANLVAPRLHHLRYLVNEIFIEGTYDVGVLPDRPVIVDCGANIGIATFYFVHRYSPRQLVAIEPDPTAYGFLTRNVSRNAWNAVELLNVAASDSDGQLEFFFDPGQAASLTMSGIRERMPVACEVVQCRRLSSLMPSHVDLLKLDVEGMEWQVLRDLTETGAISAVDRMAIEYHHHLPASTDRLSEFLAILENAGFGYRLEASRNPADSGPEYQDIMLYAHRK
jgi:FkbM family methyltransferase